MSKLMFWLGLQLLRASGATVKVNPPPENKTRFVVTNREFGWAYLFETEPAAREFIASYYRGWDTATTCTITRFVNGNSEPEQTVRTGPKVFDPAIPLFPLEASAS